MHLTHLAYLPLSWQHGMLWRTRASLMIVNDQEQGLCRQVLVRKGSKFKMKYVFH